MPRPSVKDRAEKVVNKTISLPFGGEFVFDCVENPKYPQTNPYQQGDYTIKVYDNKGDNIKFIYASTYLKKKGAITAWVPSSPKGSTSKKTVIV